MPLETDLLDVVIEAELLFDEDAVDGLDQVVDHRGVREEKKDGDRGLCVICDLLATEPIAAAFYLPENVADNYAQDWQDTPKDYAQVI